MTQVVAWGNRSGYNPIYFVLEAKLSVILGIVKSGNVLMMADCSATDSTVTTYNTFPKLIKIFTRPNENSKQYEVLIGVVGSVKLPHAISYHLDLPAMDDAIPSTVPHTTDTYVSKDLTLALARAVSEAGSAVATVDDMENNSNGFLVGLRGRIYSIDCTFGVTRNMFDYDAIGIARDIGLGALGASHDIEKAMEICHALSPYVRPPYISMEIPWGK